MTGKPIHKPQRGVVLVVALIMLLLVTLMAVAGFSLTQSNLQIVGNMESRTQAFNVANAAIEEAVSSTLFVSEPSNIFIVSCGSANTKCYDVNGDGVNDITVTVDTPLCVTVEPIKISELDLTNPQEAQCVVQDSEYSLCANSVWELRAVAVDNLTSAQAVVRQGVALKVLMNDVATACPG